MATSGRQWRIWRCGWGEGRWKNRWPDRRAGKWGLTGANNNGVCAIQIIRGTALVNPTYATWAATHAGGEASNLDHDNDGIPNGVEYFMGAPDGFTANPPVVTAGAVRTVTWPRDPNAVITSFKVQISNDLNTRTDVVAPDRSIDTSNSNQVTYTLPTGSMKQFCRLSVVTP